MEKVDAAGIPTLRASLPISLFGFGILLNLAFGAIGLARDAQATLRNVIGSHAPATPWRIYFGSIFAMKTLLIVGFACAAYLYFRRRRVTRPVLIVVLASAIILAVVDVVWHVQLDPGDAKSLALGIADALPPSIVSAAWLAYFVVSKQVGKTFVYPLRVEAPSGERTIV
jgi:hypothetical protein